MMNRLFGFTGFLAAGMAIVNFAVIFILPWLTLSASDRRSPEMWTLWAIVSAIGAVVIFRFFRLALGAHWVALRGNASMPPDAWRGILGVYLVMLAAFAMAAFPRDPVDPHSAEIYLYRILAGCSLMMATLSAFWGFARRPPASSGLGSSTG